MVAGLTALTLAIMDRRGAWLLALRPGWGAPLMVAAVLPWFVAIGIETGGRFFSEAVGGDLGRKLTSGDDSHWGPPGLHLVLLAVLSFPSCAAMPGGIINGWRQRTETASRFLLAWVVPSWIVFEAVPTKLPHYTLPLYPALCLLAASWLLDPRRRPMRTRGGGIAGDCGAGIGGGARRVAGGAGRAGLARAAGGGGSIACQHSVRPPGLATGPGAWSSIAMVTALGCAALLYWGALGLELPNLRPLWIAPQVAAMLPPGPFGSVGFAEPSLMFLAGTGTEWLLADEGASALASGKRTVAAGGRP